VIRSIRTICSERSLQSCRLHYIALRLLQPIRQAYMAFHTYRSTLISGYGCLILAPIDSDQAVVELVSLESHVTSFLRSLGAVRANWKRLGPLGQCFRTPWQTSLVPPGLRTLHILSAIFTLRRF